MKLKALAFLLGMFITINGLVGCGTESSRKDQELEKSVSYVRYLTSKRFLRKSAFSNAYPEQKPSEFVSYLFSDIGTAEWVVTGDPLEEEQLKAASVPVPSNNVVITNQFMPREDKQIVLKGSDSENQIIVETYLEGSDTPIYTEELSFEP